MRQFTIGILCSGAILAVTGCNKSNTSQGPEAVNATGGEAAAAADPAKYYTVRADDIADPTITALQGTFEMLEATAATGIHTGGQGGACLVFRAKDLGFSTMDGQKCSSNAECSNPPKSSTDDPLVYAPDPTNPTHLENRYGYCDTQNKQCWSKPIVGKIAGIDANNAVCNRPITMTPGTVNPVPKNPPAPGTGPIDVSQWVKIGDKVRVVVCLNKGTPPYPPPGAPCAQVVSANRIEVMGKPATLHK